MRGYLKFRLAILNFFEFAIWGSYLTSLGNFLWHAGLAEQIFWFYAVQGIVSLFTPALMGYIADRYLGQKTVLIGCHFMSALFKSLALVYCISSATIEFGPLFVLFSIGLGFYIPTIGLNNAMNMRFLKQSGYEPSRHFPTVRVFGTIGFIGAMLLVNFVHVSGLSLQSSPWQLGVSAAFGILTLLMLLTFSATPVLLKRAERGTQEESFRSLLADRKVSIFLLFVFLISICLQITNSYGNVYISSFTGIEEYASTWGARNANALISLSQLSEALCVLLIPIVMRIFDIKKILLIASMAWVLRFGFLGAGNTGNGIVWLLLSMIVYGIAFDFVNIAGAIYLDGAVKSGLKNRVQGLFMLVMSGLGATVGMPAAGAVVNSLVYSRPDALQQLEGWQLSWFLFALYALAISLALYFLYPKDGKLKS